MIPWLKNYLMNDCTSGIAFQDLLTTSGNITSQQNCIVCQASSFNNNLKGTTTSIYISDKTLYVKSANYIKYLKIVNSLGQPVLSSSVSAYELTKVLLLPASLYYIILSGDNFTTTHALMIR